MQMVQPLVQSLTNSSGSDVFILNINTSGMAQWATRIAGTSNDFGIVYLRIVMRRLRDRILSD